MIYKIIMEFNDLKKIIENLSKDYNIFFKNNCLYVCSKNLEDVSIKKIKNKIKDNNSYIIKIDENNFKNEPNDVVSWCKKYFIERDIKNFESNEQEYLKNLMQALDTFEQELKNRKEDFLNE